MNPRLTALHAALQALIDRKNELSAKADWTEDDKAEAASLPAKITAAQKDITDFQALESAGQTADSFLNAMPLVAAVAAGAPLLTNAQNPGQQILQSLPALAQVTDTLVHAAVVRGRAVNFKAETQEKANLKAYRFGMFALAALSDNSYAKDYCRANGIPIRREPKAAGQVESINEDGGFLVPVEFENDLIDLREQYGIFRQFAKIYPMSRETKLVPRRTGGLTAYFKGEAQAATASKKGWDNVQLVAKKILAFAYISTELDEDAIINIGDDLAGEIAYAFAALEDDCGFNGDGTSAYGGIVGVRSKLRGVDGTIANIKGLKVASGNAYSEITLADFNGVVSLLPQYADTPRTGWFVHKTFYHGVMEKLMLAAGGVTAAEVAQGRRTLIFMGYPVHISQKMPSTEANDQICALFGDLALAAAMGDRRATTIAMSEHSAFDTDELAIRGSQRFDINVHDVGTTTVGGPIVGLITAGS
jgi:HK97 family phage major capsid protein